MKIKCCAKEERLDRFDSYLNKDEVELQYQKDFEQMTQIFLFKLSHNFCNHPSTSCKISSNTVELIPGPPTIVSYSAKFA